jgi:outer membrane protein assembly factor BamB
MKYRKVFISLIIAVFLMMSLSACAGGRTTTSWPGLSADNDHAYLSYSSYVIAVRLNDGIEAWRYPEKVEGSQAFFASPVFAPDGSIMVGNYSNSLYNIDQKTGSRKWDYSDAKGKWVGSPLVTEDSVYAPSADRNLYALTLELKYKWSFLTEQSIWAQPTIDNGLLYVPSLDHNLYALTVADGKPTWKIDLDAALVSSPVLGDGSIYVGTLGREMVAVDKANGQIRWRKATEDTIWGTPVLIENTLYFGDSSGTIYALNTSDGSVVWQLKPKGPIIASPAQYEDGLIFASEDGAVLSLDLKGNIRWTKTFEGKIYTTPVVA